MSAIEKIKAKARADVKHIVLPEGTEPRTCLLYTSVVLPQPVGPTMAMRWPGETARFRWRMSLRSGV